MAPARQRFLWIGLDLVVVVAGWIALPYTRWITFALLSSGMLLAAFDAVRRLVGGFRIGRLADRLMLSLTTVLVLLTGAEVVLAVLASDPQQDAMVIPDRLAWKYVRVKGAHEAFRWHGHLHVRNRDGMRRIAPFPAKQRGVPRVAIFGDSITFGLGVAARQTYPALLRRRLPNVEILNLGVAGHQSEDVLRMMRRFVPALEPDLVVYAFYLNDFLPSKSKANVGPHRSPPGTARPEGTFVKRSRLVKLVVFAWRKLGLRMGWEQDAMANLLVDFEARRARFREDVKAMTEVLREQDRPPLLAFAVNHFPREGSRENEVAREAEAILQEAGARVIPMGDLTERLDGRDFRVSRWEAHPNAQYYRHLADHVLPVFREALEPLLPPP